MQNKTNILILVAFTISAIPIPALSAKAESADFRFKHDEFRMRFTPRTPQQIHAFYEGRGFSKPALQSLQDKCFFTTGLKNTGKNIVLSDVANWKFSANGKPVKLYNRKDWKEHWTKLQLPLGHQATFRWTQFPIKLDFRPDEGEGGNVVIPRTRENLTFEATFYIQSNNAKTPVHVKVENMKCAFD